MDQMVCDSDYCFDCRLDGLDCRLSGICLAFGQDNTLTVAVVTRRSTRTFRRLYSARRFVIEYRHEQR
jgi:hypothetical protein